MKRTISLKLLILVVLLSGLVSSLYLLQTNSRLFSFAQSGSVLAFPQAVGYGAKTRGGWGGRIIYVTNTNDSGTGSLRNALEAAGPRVVIINTSGTVNSNSDIKITNPYLTVYGNKAPGDGLQIKNGSVNIKTHDVIIRYLKVRSGGLVSGSPYDTRRPISLTCGPNGESPYNIIIDHSSLVWGTDTGGANGYCGVRDITFSYNILGEGINEGGHPDGPHSKGIDFTHYDPNPQNITIYKNLITTSNARMPQFRSTGPTDFINNIVYNWGRSAGEGASSGLNMIGNTWKKGPLSEENCAFKANIGEKGPPLNGPVYYQDESLDSGMTQLCGLSKASSAYTLSVPPQAIASAASAYSEIITNGNVGANKPVQDGTDTRIIKNVLNKTGTLLNAGLYITLSAGVPDLDTDQDGIPDNVERQYGFIVAQSDSALDSDLDGYSNLEEYLNDTNPLSADFLSGVVLPTPSSTTSPETTLRLNSVQDSFTTSRNPKNNYGSLSTLQLDSEPDKYIWLKFRVENVSRPVVRARLRLTSSESGPSGGGVLWVRDNGWKESDINWNNQPSVSGSPLDSVGRIEKGRAYTWNVSSAVTGNGIYTFVIKAASDNGVGYRSKESSSKPELLIDLQ